MKALSLYGQMALSVAALLPYSEQFKTYGSISSGRDSERAYRVFVKTHRGKRQKKRRRKKNIPH